MEIQKEVRVRVAPSPTGDPHVGTLRTALFNYLYAKKNNGKFVFRIEDTDKTREVPGSAEKIFESLEWIGTKPDEGVNYGGDLGPYLQSERLDLYQKYAKELVDLGLAYYCFCTSERLVNLREDQAKNHQPPRYDRHCRDLGDEEVKGRMAKGEPSVIRMVIPDQEVISWEDEVKGNVSFNSSELDDQILLKSDGYPTYHLAVVVDDHLMKISTVIRGEEWLSSTPKHLLLYKYFGWEAPKFAHLPLILNTDRSKLSKRHNNTSAIYYKVDQGYHPYAMRHFLMFLGWTPEKVQEYYFDEIDLVRDFTLDRVGVSPAIFDIAKLNSLSHNYLVKEQLDNLMKMYLDWLNDKRHERRPNEDKFIVLMAKNGAAAEAMIDLVRLRSNTLSEISSELEIFFNKQRIENVKVDDLLLDGKIEAKDASKALEIVKEAVLSLKIDDMPKGSEDRAKYLTEYFRSKQPADLGGREYLHPTRVSLTGDRQSMNMFEYLAAQLLIDGGKEEAIRRFDHALHLIK